MDVDGPAGAVVVGTGGNVNVPPTITAIVLAAGVIGGLFAVLTILICCRYCCAYPRHAGTTSVLKRFFYIFCVKM